MGVWHDFEKEWAWVRVGREVLNVNDPGIEVGAGVCDFEKVPPDQLDPRRVTLT